MTSLQPSVKLSRKLAELKHKLQHGAEGEFSAHVLPEECALLIAVVDRYLELEQERARSLSSTFQTSKG